MLLKTQPKFERCCNILHSIGGSEVFERFPIYFKNIRQLVKSRVEARLRQWVTLFFHNEDPRRDSWWRAELIYDSE